MALVALLGASLITAGKFAAFVVTDSAAVLSDALESLVNVAAAGFLVFTVRLAHKPADRDHPYGHGKIEFIGVGIEGGLILAAGLFIAYESIRRLITAQPPVNLDIGIWILVALSIVNFLLASWLMRVGRTCDSPAMIADGRHLMTDVVTTGCVVTGLVMVRWTGLAWLDPVFALLMVVYIFYTSTRLILQSASGLMDQIDPKDDRLIREILDDEVSQGRIDGYHKVRHRHQGSFHWVDMHLQMDPGMTVRDGHRLASRIESRLEEALGQANATSHIEPSSTEGSKPS